MSGDKKMNSTMRDRAVHSAIGSKISHPTIGSALRAFTQQLAPRLLQLPVTVTFFFFNALSYTAFLDYIGYIVYIIISHNTIFIWIFINSSNYYIHMLFIFSIIRIHSVNCFLFLYVIIQSCYF